MSTTNKEQKMLLAFYNESLDSCGECSEFENMSFMNAKELSKVLNMDIQAVGGVMSSLLEKGLIEDTGESSRDLKWNDFALTNKGIKEAEPLV